MSKLICPFCQQELQETFNIKQFWCSNYYNHTHPINLQGTKELWQELIRTRKALDVAVDFIKKIDGIRSCVKQDLYAHNKSLNSGIVFCWTTPDEIHNALTEITALEQKD